MSLEFIYYYQHYSRFKIQVIPFKYSIFRKVIPQERVMMREYSMHLSPREIQHLSNAKCSILSAIMRYTSIWIINEYWRLIP